MFTVKIDEDEYKVEFDYVRGNYSKPIKCTRCYIIRNATHYYGIGVANVHPKETPNKNIGRKISLSRALKNAKFDQLMRKLFWEAYYNARGGKW